MNLNLPHNEEALDRIISDLGPDAAELSPAELEAVIESAAWAETALSEPSPDLKRRIFDSLPDDIEFERELPRPPVRMPLSFKLAVALPWAAVLAMGVFVALQSKENSKWKDLALAQSTKLESLVTKVDSLERTQKLDRLEIVSLKSDLDNSYAGSAVWDSESGSGLLKVSQIPQLEPGKDYQLWIVDPQYQTPVDGGVFQVDSNGTATIRFQPGKKVNEVSAFAVSLERKGGVAVAEGPMVLVGAM